MAEQKDKNEMTFNELFDKSEKLIEEGKYEEVIMLLNDNLLTSYKTDHLYALRAEAKQELLKYNEAINDLNIAIEISPYYDMWYGFRGDLFFEIKDYDSAIKDFTMAIQICPQDPVYYSARADVYIEKDEYPKAISDLDHALKLAPNNSQYYSDRGYSYLMLDNFSSALSDYNQAINLNPEEYDNYYMRAFAFAQNEDYDNAIKDYSKCIESDSYLEYGYHGRGSIYYYTRRYNEAISDFKNAILENPNQANTYAILGLCFECINDFKNALMNYDKAIELDQDLINIKNDRDNLKARLKIKIDLDENNTSSVLQVFVRFLDAAKINEDSCKEILNIYVAIKANGLDKIKEHAAKNLEKIITDKKVAHYSKLNTADIFACDKEGKQKFRYYNAVYMNDPEEGIVVLDCLDDSVRKCYENANSQEEDSIYIGSFLPAMKHQDELVMWRTYGKDERGTEGAGCSIIINTDFFDSYNEVNSYINPEMLIDGKSSKADTTPQCLYRVLYYNKHHNQPGEKKFKCDGGEQIENDISQLNTYLKQLVQLKENKHGSILDVTIDKIVYHIISEIRYFFKSADYEFENEIRIIQFAAKNSTLLKIDELPYPKKVYLESNKPVQPYLEKIILGPKVPHPKQWLYLDVAMRKNNPKPVPVSISECKYQ